MQHTWTIDPCALTVAEAHRIYIDKRSEEIWQSPADLASAFGKYIELHATRCGQALKAAAFGTVGDMLNLDDVLSRAVAVKADEDWHEVIV